MHQLNKDSKTDLLYFVFNSHMAQQQKMLGDNFNKIISHINFDPYKLMIKMNGNEFNNVTDMSFLEYQNHLIEITKKAVNEFNPNFKVTDLLINSLNFIVKLAMINAPYIMPELLLRYLTPQGCTPIHLITQYLFVRSILNAKGELTKQTEDCIYLLNELLEQPFSQNIISSLFPFISLIVVEKPSSDEHILKNTVPLIKELPRLNNKQFSVGFLMTLLNKYINPESKDSYFVNGLESIPIENKSSEEIEKLTYRKLFLLTSTACQNELGCFFGSENSHYNHLGICTLSVHSIISTLSLKFDPSTKSTRVQVFDITGFDQDTHFFDYISSYLKLCSHFMDFKLLDKTDIKFIISSKLQALNFYIDTTPDLSKFDHMVDLTFQTVIKKNINSMPLESTTIC